MDRRNGMSLREAVAQRRSEQARQAQSARAQVAVEEPVAAGRAPLTRVYRQARASGHLNASTRALKAFPTEILRLHELVEGDEKSWECRPLTKVDLSHNEIPSLPPTISKLHVITSIKLRHNKLTTLPQEFFDLTTLTSIDLSNNALEGDFPDALGRLVKLREIGLEHNKLTSLPDSLCELAHLEILRVEDNQLTALPDQFGKLQKLHTLGAHSNQLTSLPQSFAQLTNLTTLDLKKNALATIGHAVERLARLRFLDLRQNKLVEFPFLPVGAPPLDQLMLGFNALPEVDEASILRTKDSLTVLDLRDNKLQALPEKFAHLYRLKSLDLSNNDLHDLLPGLGYLKDLNHIAIDGNPLRSIRRSAISAGTQALKKYLRTRGSPPEGVDALEQEFDEFALREIQQKQDEQGGLVLDEDNAEVAGQYEYLFRDAASNGILQMVDMRLQILPEPIQGAGKFKFAETLVQLNVSRNRLGELTSAIGELKALQTLTAEECALTTLDASIAMLPNLQHVRLRKNALTTDAVETFLAREASANICYSLKELDLRNNQLTQMPARFRFLSHVDTLMLSYNRLQNLDDFPWAAMRHLSVVSLADNQLDAIGPVYELPNLTSLSVENNNLRQIPSELGACENLRALYIAGNPQRSVRLNIVSEGTDAILKYLKNRLPIGYESPAKAFVDTAPRVPTTRTNNQDEHQSGETNKPPVKNPRVDTQTPAARTLAFGHAGAGEETDNNQTTHAASPNPAEYKRARRATSAAAPSTHVDLRRPSFESAARQRPPPVVPPSFHTPPPAPVHARAAPAAAAASDSTDESEVTDLVVLGYDEKIRKLEIQLDDYALSQPKKFALKKELAMVRSLKIRHIRAKEQAK